MLCFLQYVYEGVPHSNCINFGKTSIQILQACISVERSDLPSFEFSGWAEFRFLNNQYFIYHVLLFT
jgi:hypothetical protein